MSLHPQQLGVIPSETIRVAKAAFPKGNIYLRMRDELGVFYSDNHFNSLFSQKGKPAFCPWRLALITIMQYVEGLTDRQAADAVRSRLDWKYALGLELTDSGFDFSVLSEFRNRLIEGGLEQQLLEEMLKVFKEQELLKSPQKQRTDSTHILAAVRVLNRLENIGETLRYALNSIAAVAPDWLRNIVPDEEWYSRYGQRFQENRLPTSKKERNQMAVMIGHNGNYLLDIIWSNSELEWLRHLEAVEILRLVWIQQFYVDNGQLKLREGALCPPSNILINSPYDPDVRMGNKRTRQWIGYKVHLSETCDENLPHLITYVETTPSSKKDHEIMENLHKFLDENHLAPSQHLADSAYIDTDLLISSRKDYEIDLIGPIQKNPQWQAREGKGFSIADFKIDWKQKIVSCPNGKIARTWSPKINRYQQPVIQIAFKKSDCQSCPNLSDCTKAKCGYRTLTIRSEECHKTLLEARARQTTKQFKKQYASRAGIEGTISQGTRAFGLRFCRYRGFPKTRLQHILTACAINLVRVWEWWTDAYTFGTSPSRFAALAP